MLGGSFFDTAIVLLLGLIVLIFSADRVVSKLIIISKHFGFSTTFVGMTVLSIGTSLAEVSTQVIGSWGVLNGMFDFHMTSATLLGTNIGSDVVQQTFIMGLTVLLGGAILINAKFIKYDFLPLIGVTVLCLLLGLDGTYSRFDGGILLALFIGYMYFLYRRETEHHHYFMLELHTKRGPIVLEFFIAIAGIFAMLGSSYVILKSVEWFVGQTSLSGSFIGVITLGIATALPELITALAGIYKKEPGISLGTLIGSNIVNPLLGMGLGAVMSTYWIPQVVLYWDLPMKILTGVLMVVYVMLHKGKLGRFGACFLIVMYVAYILLRIRYFPTDI